MTQFSAAAIAATVDAYLAHRPDGANGRALDVGSRAVHAHSGVWRPWLDGTKRARSALPGQVMPEAPSRAALELLDELPAPAAALDGEDCVVTRSHLATLSQGAVDDHARTKAWVAVMIWGSGTSNGRGPWRTSQGLRAEALHRSLAQSQASVREGDVAGAYRAFRVTGSGEAFLTKWLWVAGLAGSTGPVPLVLDSRVLETLALIHGDGWRVSRGASRYAAYVDAMESAARQLSTSDRAVTGEQLEWLTWVRAEGSLNQWLTDRA